jgi:hypothetical protein
LNKWSLKDAVTFASALAAIKCTKIGGRIGIPGLSEVRKFLAEKEETVGCKIYQILFENPCGDYLL